MTIADQAIQEFVGQLPEPFLGIHRTRLELAEPMVDIASRFADETGTIALLSDGPLDSARYHILGLRPWLSIRERAGEVVAEFAGNCRSAALDPFGVLDALVKRYNLPGQGELQPLSAGLLGYLAYDLKDYLEVLPRTSCDDRRLPRMYLVAPSILVVHDRRDNETHVYIPIVDDGREGAQRRLAQFQEELRRPKPVRVANTRVGELTSGLSRSDYIEAVEAIRDYIVRGHVYQVNMSQRFETAFSGDAFALFAGLFATNPAAFFAFIQAGDHQVVSTSPERFLQLSGRVVETRPIKGTRARGESPEKDRALQRELETSFKDDAELSMIVDLLRNDLGKVCVAQSVRVTEHKRVEAYKNVFHLVSIVVGELDDDQNAVDLIRATFPGGSITGCPKIRAMEIIDELEPVRRHIYTGSIGYVGFHGTMELSIAIRTAVIHEERLVFSVGGGVVFDSNADEEYAETLHKGRSLANALQQRHAPAAADDSERTGTEVPPPPERFAWCNGKIKRLSDLVVSVEDEGFAYGYGCFETIRVQRGQALLLDAHMARFRRAWEQFFTAPFPDLTWRDVIEYVVRKNRLEEQIAAVKLVASAGKPDKADHDITLLASARPYVHRLDGCPRKGLRLVIYPHRRHSHLADYKTTNYMFQRIAAKWAGEQQADEAVILNADGSVSETNSANLLCRIDGKMCRPFSEHVLPGTMEQAACRLLATWGMPVRQRRLTVDELTTADSIILTNALMGAVPVIRIGGKALAADTPLCERINLALLGQSLGRDRY